ncbi:transcriptional regulator [Mycolicibacterium mucogenicum]|uniref:TetR/AcrR family transcriptional regulator n=2 Tax=Mycolicibacterium mucogenicum TaxID=56689 RepID=A0A8H2PGW2_MYCMU|nr:MULTISPECIES: TetR/AcrR family transcriptional regulator [Mycobacteriaceae]KAB7758320.1 transcriptional regulator [Mycolicibacterium mucogenicum DSM 44124]OBJ44447.1 transcriptional regulator [Mycolicibacterium mucogenicum]QPG71746.1 TetR/AcrR family transcriptional regulator [Mycolicibacterium mucogenicum DSM 44124]SDZ84948.1 DNA-binding transcriptional regulator, AcrR family [Mycobacterium sp. 283mftsu]
MPAKPPTPRTISPALLEATAETLHRLGPRQFSLTAVAEAAGVSRGTVYNALGGRDHAISVALDHLASTFVDGMAAEIDKQSTLADQVAAAAVLICAHRQSSPSAPQKGINEGIVVLLLRNIGEDLMKRAVELWKPRVKAAQRDGEIGPGVDPARAGEWIVRVLLSFELLPPIGVNLDNPRAIRRFVTDHIINGLNGEAP